MRAMSCPFRTRSPSFTGSSRRSPEMFDDTLTVVAAWSFPAAVTLRVMGLFFAVAICTWMGGSARGLSDSPTIASTASTKAAATMRLGHDMAGFRFRWAAGAGTGGGAREPLAPRDRLAHLGGPDVLRLGGEERAAPPRPVEERRAGGRLLGGE